MKIFTLIALLAIAPNVSFAKCNHMMNGEEPTKEQKEKMASAHEKMAACLKSSSTVKACMEEMQKTMGEDCDCMKHHGKKK